MSKVDLNIQEGQFLVSIDGYIIKCYDYDTDKLEKIRGYDTKLAQIKDEDSMWDIGYSRYQLVSWLIDYRDSLKIAPTVAEYFDNKRLLESVDYYNLPF